MWGLGEIIWQLEQQTDVLRSIDHTLKTPSETKANEWRLQAEELRRRGLLEESEEFFLKALNEYRLDYRAYVGLAETYLRMNNPDKAKLFFEKSLPHAPDNKWKAYSYRLIGHIYACDENYPSAIEILDKAIALSPTYADAYYDHAQYCAQVGLVKSCLSSLEAAVLAKPLYWYLSQKERNFNPLREEVKNLMDFLMEKAYSEVEDLLSQSEKTLERIFAAIRKIETLKAKAWKVLHLLHYRCGYYGCLYLGEAFPKREWFRSELYTLTLAKLNESKEAIKTKDYQNLVEAKAKWGDFFRFSSECKGKLEEIEEFFEDICNIKIPLFF